MMVTDAYGELVSFVLNSNISDVNVNISMTAYEVGENNPRIRQYKTFSVKSCESMMTCTNQLQIWTEIRLQAITHIQH